MDIKRPIKKEEGFKMLDIAVPVNPSNIATDMVRAEKIFSNTRFWHKIIVHNVGHLPRNVVLKHILDFVYPCDFIPIKYTIQENDAYFFVRNCKDAIHKIAKVNLIIPKLQEPREFYKLSLILAYTSIDYLKVNVQQNIMDVLKKRFNTSSKVLDLSNFSSDEDLEEYSSFSQPKILYFVLLLSKPLQIETLKLNGNDIRVVAVDALISVKALTKLDLRNNCIENLTDLVYLKNLHISTLWLDGNPICNRYDEMGYIKAIREVCPGVKVLDGISLMNNNGFLQFRRNYVCDMQGKELADQFIEHFFTLYDSGDRTDLQLLYDKNAMFSLSTQYIPGQSTSAISHLEEYVETSRNIRNLSDLAKVDKGLYVGRMNIMKILSKLPPTEHDVASFTVDLLFYTEKMVTVLVKGVFREPGRTLLETEWIRGFSRCFVLCARNNGEYNITNEMLLVSNATTYQQKMSSKAVPVAKYEPIGNAVVAHNVEERKAMTEVFGKITKLNHEWCKRFLDESGFDLMKAFKLFIELYKIDKVPNHAFC